MKNNNILSNIFLSAFLFGVFLSLNGCKKIDVPKDTPRCIKQKIREENKNSGCLKGVYQYECSGIIVYYFEKDCPTFAPVPSIIIDEKCNDFKGCNLNVAANKKIIWQR